ncbi:hypothetical protein EAH57_15535 [Acinetobacter sp. 2JN-4]|uniref:hypothetical protein n=1 Tax=Acinetobacter sp. 2JN-4 TaxID=2479844 RepID=UPI000EF98F1A|nr:hypothetical protein [Acinetobacter sp. 2JN-4]RLZ06648.1 hypothetical protein EAH57_15535 [Acinetobacter sp. 2JN-4]
MNKLDLCPLQSSYSVKYGTSVERIALRGGFSRYVQTKNAKKHLVDVAFTLREDDFIYFRAFYLNWQLNPLPFLMSLIIEDSEFREYIAQFVPDSFSFNELNGKIFKVSAQLIVATSEVQILTSKPYPVFFGEDLKTQFNVLSPVLHTVYKSTELDESLQTQFEVLSPVRVDAVVYSSITTELELLQTQFEVLSPVRVDSVIYSSITTDVESLQTQFSVLNLKREILLLSQDTEIESFQTQLTVLNPVKGG